MSGTGKPVGRGGLRDLVVVLVQEDAAAVVVREGEVEALPLGVVADDVLGGGEHAVELHDVRLVRLDDDLGIGVQHDMSSGELWGAGYVFRRLIETVVLLLFKGLIFNCSG